MACSVPSKMGVVSKSLEKTFWGGQENFYFVGDILLWGRPIFPEVGQIVFWENEKKNVKSHFLEQTPEYDSKGIRTF